MFLIFLAIIFILIVSLSLFIYVNMNKLEVFKLPSYLATEKLRFKIKFHYIAGTILNTLFYKENSAQKEMLTNFRKLGKVRIIGRDETQRIIVKILFTPVDVCFASLTPNNGWRVETALTLGKGRQYFEKFNLPWSFGSPKDVEEAVARTTTENLLIKL